MTLTAARLREVLRYEPETGRFYWKPRPRSDFKTSQGYGSWMSCCHGKEAGANTGHGYRQISVDNVNYFAHRLAWLHVHGEWPKQHIDHINGDGTDNRIENLRDVSNTENHRNTKIPKNNKTGVVGVRLSVYGTWRATIWSKAKIIHLGSFPDKESAVVARKAAERELGYHPNHGSRAA